MKQATLRTSLIALVLFASVTSCSTSSSMLSSGSALMSALGSNPSLSTMSSLLSTPGLDKVLGSALKDPFTLLAPSNDAFKALGESALNELKKPENIDQLAGVINSHLLKGKLDPSILSNTANSISTMSGSKLDLSGVDLGQMTSSEGFNLIPIDKVLK